MSISDVGNVNGRITVPYVVLNGKVKGVVTSKRVELSRTARVSGDVYYNLTPSSCIVDQKKWSNLIEAFKQDLAFGTSGIRGKLVVSLDENECTNDLKSLHTFGFQSDILRGTNSFNEITVAC